MIAAPADSATTGAASVEMSAMSMNPHTIAATATAVSAERSRRSGIGVGRAASDETMASIGATRHARNAGTIAASTVATAPMTTARSSADQETVGPPTGTAVPRVPSTRSINRPSNRPSGAPTIEATAASIAASASATPRS